MDACSQAAAAARRPADARPSVPGLGWPLVLGPEITRDFEAASRREWLETNGLGGWASSTVSGAHSRRYHGLLVAATQPPAGRLVLLSRLDETLQVDGMRHELSTNRFPGVVHPRGFEYLQRFERGLFPVFVWAGACFELRKTVVAVHGHNTVIVRYEVMRGTGPMRLELRPFVAGRDYHHLVRCNDAVQREATCADGVLRLPTYPGLPVVQLRLPRQAHFVPAPEWYYDFEYDREAYRGLDHREDLFTHGTVQLVVHEGDRLHLLASIEAVRDADPEALLRVESRRRRDLLPHREAEPRGSLAGPARRGTTELLGRYLRLAADQFVVRRGEDLRTLIAGYHWFMDWGRDTMISLPGLALVTGRFDEARRILRAFAGSLDQGLVPNRFPDHGGGADYNTVDASLWFFVAVHRYLEVTADETFVVDELMPVLEEILDWHEHGTGYGIHVDEDGLLAAGEAGQQLTWMDAKVGDWVVTPRRGKPVEVQALWYNALRIYGQLASFESAAAAHSDAESKAARVRARFQEVFWNPAESCFFDVVDVDGQAGVTDGAVRPNQVLALSLPFPLAEGEQALQVLRVVEAQLATPRGLRTLSPASPHYRGGYGGDQVSRDGAYHQGTVWAWLLGPYLSAWLRHGGLDGRARARHTLEAFAGHLTEACVGSVSEIFDGDAPHEPRGAVAQAWSVAELLRVLDELDA